MAGDAKPKSNLVMVGIFLILAGVFMPQTVMRALEHKQLTLAWGLLIDGLRLCFFIGVGCVLIGWTRNRKTKRRDGE